MLATEPEATMKIEVTPLTEGRIFEFIKDMYVADPDNDWYITFITNGVVHPSGILVDVLNEEVVISNAFTPALKDEARQQEKVWRESVTQVKVWRIL